MIDFDYENLSDCVFHHAATQPDAPALHQGRTTITYAHLATLVAQAATWLTQSGVKPQDHVGIILSNSIERVALALALMRIGAIGIELPTETTKADLAALVARFAITTTLTEPAGPPPPAGRTLIIALTWRDDIAALPPGPRFAGDPATLTLLNLSSGTTGLPKAYLSTHQSRLVRSRMTLNANTYYQQPTPGPLALANPASTNLTWGVLINHLLLGWPIILLPAYQNLADLVREAASWDEAIFPLPPGMARLMLNHAPTDGRLLYPRMRALITAGQAISTHDKQALIARATPNVYEFYGSGGIGMLTSLSPAEALRQPGSVGKPVRYPGVEVEIANPHGKRLPPDTLGLLRIRGPNTAYGFLNPEDNQRGDENFTDGWYYPGEIATLTKSGFLILEGRRSDAIKSGNALIYPQDIESILLEHKSVIEAAIIGRPSLMPGPQAEDIVAFITARPDLQHPEILEHCRRKLTPNKRPAFIYYLDSMPRTPNGKIDRAALKAAPLKRITPV